MSTSFTIVEIEFSGNQLRHNHVVELAMVRIDQNGKKHKLHKVIRPPSEVSDFLLALVAIDRKTLEAAPLFADVAHEISEFCADTILVGMNIRLIYALLRREFKRADLRFVHKHICLKRLTEEQFAQLKVKTTGGVCEQLGIEFSPSFTPTQRARSMAQLFKHLFLKRLTQRAADKSFIHQTTSNTKIPANLSFDKVDKLPNAIGVYYFLDHKGRIIYLGKSNDIKKRILSHFNSDLEDFSRFEMKTAIYDVQYRLTGSELIALLLESDEIKRFMPKFNRAQRRVKYTHGVYICGKPDEYLQLKIGPLADEGLLLMKFAGKWRALSFILYAAAQFGLQLALCGLGAYQKQAAEIETEVLPNEQLPPTEPEPIHVHNARIAELLTHFSYPASNILLLDTGRTDEEISVVLIENNVYEGYAYLPQNMVNSTENLPDTVREYLIPFRDNPDVQRIIRTYLRQHEQSLTVLTF